MKTQKYAWYFLFCCFIFSSCLPYTSNVPLSGKKHRVRSNLLGKWEKCPAGESCTYLLITTRSDVEYNLTYKRYDTSAKKWDIWTKRGFLSYLDGDWYINIETEEGYQVTKVITYLNTLYLYGLDYEAFLDGNQKKIAFNSSTDFRNYISFYFPKEDLFLPPQIFTKL